MVKGSWLGWPKGGKAQLSDRESICPFQTPSRMPGYLGKQGAWKGRNRERGAAPSPLPVCPGPSALWAALLSTCHVADLEDFQKGFQEDVAAVGCRVSSPLPPL